jgi:hypothetical protein
VKQSSSYVSPLALLVIVALTACSSSHHAAPGTTASRGSSSKPSSPVGTTTPRLATMVVELPVVRCAATSGARPFPGGNPDHEAIRLPAAAAGRVWLYSNGIVTVMAPAHWICSASVAADGSMSMFVVPAGSVTSTNPNLDYTGVFVSADNTGHGFGEALVCGYFPRSAAALVGQLCDHPAPGTKTKQLTADVVRFTHGPTSGLVIYPNAGNATASVTVAKISCDAGPLCAAILGDALTRFAPPSSRTTGPPNLPPP